MKRLIIALSFLFSFNSVCHANNELQLKTASDYFICIGVTSALLEQKKEKFIQVMEDYINSKDFEKTPPHIQKEIMKTIINNLKSYLDAIKEIKRFSYEAMDKFE